MSTLNQLHCRHRCMQTTSILLHHTPLTHSLSTCISLTPFVCPFLSAERTASAAFLPSCILFSSPLPSRPSPHASVSTPHSPRSSVRVCVYPLLTSRVCVVGPTRPRERRAEKRGEETRHTPLIPHSTSEKEVMYETSKGWGREAG